MIDAVPILNRCVSKSSVAAGVLVGNYAEVEAEA
jgi:hypothetical protein